MINTKTIFAALALAAALVTAPAVAQDHTAPHIERMPWSFSGVFGTYDRNQLQRGFQVFREVCSSCHSARLLSFRNLSEEGGPEFSAEQVKALAAQYEVNDPEASGGKRPAIPADRWPSPFDTEQQARDANGGALPPDMSVLAKARGVTDPFPTWMFNYFTAYQEGGPDYIHALLNGYQDPPPAGVEIPEGKHYNAVFPGHAISMAPPLTDGRVAYAAAEGQAPVPQTVEQYSEDVSAFLYWLADPHMASRKEAGFRVILFLFLFAGLMYFTKRRIWKGIEH